MRLVNNILKKTAALGCSAALALGAVGVVPAAAEETGFHDQAVSITESMPLRQRITQMIMPSIRYWSDDGSVEARKNHEVLAEPLAEYISQNSFGGVLLFAENVSGTEQTTRFTYDLQNAAAQSEFGIPLLIAADQEGGSVVRLGTGTNTCGNMALGATGNTDYAYENADIMGRELAAVGINQNFGPVLDVNNNPANPVINIRSFSSVPELVSEMGLSYIKAMQDNNIVTTAKHFPGHGNTNTDSHTGLPLINSTYEELKQCELVPFQAAFDAGIDMIMTAHIQYPLIEKNTYVSISSGETVYLPATLSKTILTDIVRDDMGFEGVVITDSMQMDALAKNYDIYETAVMAINAGVDILLDPFVIWSEEDIAKAEDYIDHIVQAVNDGLISEDRINESCTRVIELKLKRGLFDNKVTDIEAAVQNALSVVGSKENHSKEMEITMKSVTLVINNDNVLPLQAAEGDSFAFFYPFANRENSFVYAFDTLKKIGIVPEGAAATYNCYNNTDAADFTETVQSSKALIISAENWGEADIDPTDDYNGWMTKFILELIDLAHSYDKPVIVMSMVLPYDIAAFTGADAVLAGYGQKKMPEIPNEDSFNGEFPAYGPNYPATVFTIFGGNNPTGKLPVDIFAADENHRFTDEILFNAGYGLSYEFVSIRLGTVGMGRLAYTKDGTEPVFDENMYINDAKLYAKKGTVIKASAMPYDGYQFVCWKDSDGAVYSEDSAITFEADKDTELTAVFELIPEDDSDSESESTPDSETESTPDSETESVPDSNTDSTPESKADSNPSTGKAFPAVAGVLICAAVTALVISRKRGKKDKE